MAKNQINSPFTNYLARLRLGIPEKFQNKSIFKKLLSLILPELETVSTESKKQRQSKENLDEDEEDEQNIVDFIGPLTENKTIVQELSKPNSLLLNTTNKSIFRRTSNS